MSESRAAAAAAGRTTTVAAMAVAPKKLSIGDLVEIDWRRYDGEG
jgi:hypothetical protein